MDKITNHSQKLILFSFYLFCIFFTQTNAYSNETIKLQLLWKNQFEFAGFYIAKEKGFYEEQGLDVKINEYDGDLNIVNDVLAHKSDIGIGRTSLVLDRLQGKKINLLFTTFQSSPHVLIAKKRDDLSDLRDFKNKKIMVSDNLDAVAAISAMMKVGKITSRDYEELHHSFNIEDVIDDKVDLMSVYLSNEPYAFIEKNLPFTIFNPKDYGFDFYSDIVFTSSEYLKQNEQNVQKFVIASKKGWNYAFENIDETVDIILKHYNTQNKTKEALLYEAHILKSLAFSKDIPFGTLTNERVEELANLYRLMGETKESNSALEDFIYVPKSFLEHLQAFLTPERIVFILFGIFVLVFFFWYKHSLMRSQNKRLEQLVDQKTKALQQLNENLENQVSERTQELRIQKNELKTIFENSKDGIAVLDFDTNFLYFNDAYLEMTGYTKEELEKQSCIGMTDPSDYERTQASLEELKQNRYVTNFEKKCLKKDGTKYIVNITQTILPNTEKILVTAKDVTLLKEKDKMIYEQAKIVSNSELLQNIAHQWRQPLNMISIRTTGLLFKNELGVLETNEVVESLEEISHNIQNLSNMIDMFQTLFQSSHNTTNYTSSNLTTLTKNFITLAELTLLHENITLDHEINLIDCNVKIDEIEFTEVLLNLINNAKDQFHTLDKEDKWVKIKTFKENNSYCLTIEDNATGIPDEVLPKIFDPYFTTKHQSQGVGLSLFMCYETVVYKWNGKIEAMNSINGALFRIEIPCI